MNFQTKIKNLFNIKLNKKIVISACLVTLIAISLITLIPFAVSNVHSGADYPYHLSVIQALNQAWQNGTFGQKIVELIGNDYGYGTGLFYSTLPAGTAVVFMNIFGLNLTGALYLEISILTALSAIIVFLFANRVFKNSFTAFIISLIYILYPYFFGNLYYRFAYSEMFFMLYIPMIAWGLYELIENSNYKLFMIFFTLGITLGVLTHVTLLVYIVAFAGLYILVNIKKFISGYKYIPFIISCLLVLFLSACYYIPMLLNYGVVNVANMGYDMKSIYDSLIFHFTPSSWMFFSNFLNTLVFILFAILFIYRCINKLASKKEIGFFIVSTTVYIVTSPIFPWLILPDIFGMIQFVHRLLMLCSLFYVLQLGYIISNFKLKTASLIFTSVIFGYSLCNCVKFSRNAFDTENSAYSETVITDKYTGFDVNNGLGWGKNGDYYPNGATRDYVFHRVNENIISSTNLDVKEFTHLQSLNQISFVVTPFEDDYVELNIPYAVLQNKEIHQISSNYNNIHYETSIIACENDANKSRILLKQNEIECKIIICYEENDDLQKYLQKHPFEFLVKSGNATASNFVKQNVNNYKVDFNVSEETIVELPTFFYKGYKLTYTLTSGEVKNLEAMHGENGFIEVKLSESGTLNVEFEANYIKWSNIISILGLIIFLIVCGVVLAVPRKFFSAIADWIDRFFERYNTLAEIIRFLVVGAVATIVDMLVMGFVMYAMQPSIYASFLNVFINSPDPSTLATIIGTTVGSIAGMLVSYVLSIIFVFNEKGESKSVKGFAIFAFLTAIGLGINMLGTYLLYDLIHVNQWITKIVMVIIVLIYNYISKRLMLFKDKTKTSEDKILDILMADIKKNKKSK